MCNKNEQGSMQKNARGPLFAVSDMLSGKYRLYK